MNHKPTNPGPTYPPPYPKPTNPGPFEPADV